MSGGIPAALDSRAQRRAYPGMRFVRWVPLLATTWLLSSGTARATDLAALLQSVADNARYDPSVRAEIHFETVRLFFNVTWYI